jgi:hypothetical protein
LGLIAAGEKGELARVGASHVTQPFGGEPQRLVPRDFLELTFASLAGPEQRSPKPRRRKVLHDSLPADDTAVHGMVAVPLDVGDAPILDVHVNAAAAGAHVACLGLDLVGKVGAQIHSGLLQVQLDCSNCDDCRCAA